MAYVQSSCDTPSGRDDYVKELMNHIPIDSYGYCLHNKDLPPHLRDPQKMKDVEFLHILAKYKFVIAIENAVCEDYITEKLWKVIQVKKINWFHVEFNWQKNSSQIRQSAYFIKQTADGNVNKAQLFKRILVSVMYKLN